MLHLLAWSNVQATSDSTQSVKKLRMQSFENGMAIGFHQFRDKAVSPLIYNGPAVMARIALSTYGFDIIRDRYFHFHAGIGGNRYAQFTSTTASAFAFELGHHELHRIFKEQLNKNSKLRLYGGASIFALFQFRVNPAFMNNAFTRELCFELVPAAALEKDFSVKAKTYKLFGKTFNKAEKNYTFHFRANMPLMSYIDRPTYVVVEPSETILANMFDGKVEGFYRLFHLQTRTEISKHLKNGNQVKLGYYWDFMHYNPGNNGLALARHSVLFSIVFRLNALHENGR
jgi:hypothetical protein